MIKLLSGPKKVSVLGLDSQNGKVYFPTDHQAGMKVPKGGSSCANCKYLGEDEKSCESKYYKIWHGSKELPEPADEYCSDWYEPKEEL
jgi:hypothetical protein